MAQNDYTNIYLQYVDSSLVETSLTSSQVEEIQFGHIVILRYSSHILMIFSLLLMLLLLWT